MTSVKKILKKEFITKEMKQKVLDRMQFRKKSNRNLVH